MLLPHGKTVDLVIRSVSDTESKKFNERMATMPGGTGVISDRRWTVALEAKGENGIQTRYNSDVSVGQHVERLGTAGSRFKLIGGNAAVDKSAKPILIRNLVARDASDKQAIHRIPHPPRRASTCIRRSPRSFRPSTPHTPASNALQYGEPGTPVTIETKNTGSSFTLSVRMTGRVRAWGLDRIPAKRFRAHGGKVVRQSWHSLAGPPDRR